MELYINTKQLSEIGICLKEELELMSVSTLIKPKNNSLLFIKKKSKDVENLKDIQNCLIVAYPSVLEDYDQPFFKNNFIYLSDNPRLCFIKILTKMIVQKGVVDLQNDYLDLGFSRYVHKSAQLHDSVVIEANVTIGERVKIKKGTVLKSGVVIKSNVSIGEHCSIGSGTIIGNSGFGAERDLDDRIYMMPHVGGVIIKDRVYVGSNTTIVAGTIEPTFIDNEVKIDDLSVIAHNCHIQKSVIVCGGSSIGGSVLIGERSWIGSGAIILQSTKIGSDVTIGIGGVVRRNLKDKIVVLGNPAEKLSSYIAIKRKLNKI